MAINVIDAGDRIGLFVFISRQFPSPLFCGDQNR
jgi:hypothetical protein